MDEEISIINTSSRNERIKNFFAKNKKTLIVFFSIIILIILSLFAFSEIEHRKNKSLAKKYNDIMVNFHSEKKNNFKNSLVEIITEKNSTYSPLALYFIIENNIVKSQKDINEYFDIIINETSLEKESKNLIIYKKALYNSENESENKLLEIINPIIKSNSIWKTHALYLMAEYFYANGQMQKAKDFYTQIINLEKGNREIILEAQKRLSRDLGEK